MAICHLPQAICHPVGRYHAPMPGRPSVQFDDCAAPLLASGAAEMGTIMGGPCLRVGDAFLAMPYHMGPGIVVKLPRARVAELIAQGVGEPFAPAGRAFKEWVLVKQHEPALWEALLAEGLAFARGG
jgi:hypothetical protein